jgi:hypothetical protein
MPDDNKSGRLNARTLAESSRYRTTTVLQKISVFLRDFDSGTYEDYWNLVTTHFIAPELN